MRKALTFCDYFVICSGSSHRMVKAISDEIKKSLQSSGISPSHTEGEKEASWALIDYGDVIVHIFYEETRSFYNLEWLWSDAARLNLTHSTTLRVNPVLRQAQHGSPLDSARDES